MKKLFWFLLTAVIFTSCSTHRSLGINKDDLYNCDERGVCDIGDHLVLYIDKVSDCIERSEPFFLNDVEGDGIFFRGFRAKKLKFFISSTKILTKQVV